jgi:sialic acid synthase SpsE
MVAFAATAMGACVIEKHFTLNRADGGPDSAFSIEPRELSELVKGTAMIWKAFGEVTYGARLSEQTSLKERPSIYVVETVQKGEPFTVRNLRVIRPGNGLAPKYFESIIGCVAATHIAAETPLSLEMIGGKSLEDSERDTQKV